MIDLRFVPLTQWPGEPHPTADKTAGMWDRLNQALSLLEAQQ